VSRQLGVNLYDGAFLNEEATEVAVWSVQVRVGAQGVVVRSLIEQCAVSSDVCGTQPVSGVSFVVVRCLSDV